MTDADIDFAGLLCARICHDLVSPVGAIGNGLELLGGDIGDPRDLQLLTESASAASAALSFLRLAFGALGAGAPEIGVAELRAIVANHLATQRRRIEIADGLDAIPRPLAKLACLALMTGVTAIPYGGVVRVDRLSADPKAVEVSALDARAALDPHLAALATDPANLPESPRETHLALLAREARSQGCAVRVDAQEGAVRILVA